jgi:hypothetical protein
MATIPSAQPTWSEAIFGRPGRVEQFPRFTPEQQGLQSQAIGGAQGLLGRMGQFDFAPIAQQARERFQTQTLPGLVNQFAGTGGMAGSAFARALGGAGRGFETDLAALQQNYNLKQEDQMMQRLQQLLGVGMAPSFESAYMKPQQGFGPQLLQALLRIAPTLIGTAFGGPAGGAAGAAGGEGISELLKNLFTMQPMGQDMMNWQQQMSEPDWMMNAGRQQ